MREMYIAFYGPRINNRSNFPHQKRCLMFRKRDGAEMNKTATLYDMNELLIIPSADPRLNFFGDTPLFFRYSGVNAATTTNFLAKRR